MKHHKALLVVKGKTKFSQPQKKDLNFWKFSFINRINIAKILFTKRKIFFLHIIFSYRLIIFSVSGCNKLGKAKPSTQALRQQKVCSINFERRHILSFSVFIPRKIIKKMTYLSFIQKMHLRDDLIIVSIYFHALWPRSPKRACVKTGFFPGGYSGSFWWVLYIYLG